MHMVGLHLSILCEVRCGHVILFASEVWVELMSFPDRIIKTSQWFGISPSSCSEDPGSIC